MFPTKTVVFMSAFLMAAPFGLSSSAVSAYPGEGVMEGARDMQQDMNQARRDFRDLKENNSDRGSYREDRDMRRHDNGRHEGWSRGRGHDRGDD